MAQQIEFRLLIILAFYFIFSSTFLSLFLWLAAAEDVTVRRISRQLGQEEEEQAGLLQFMQFMARQMLN